MKRIYLLFFAAISLLNATSQQVDWVVSNPVKYNMNPGLVYQTLATSANGNVICSRLDTSYINYNNSVFGRTYVECLDGSGHVLWSFIMSDSVVVRQIYSDANNDIYIGGRFLGTANLNNVDTLNNHSTLDYSESEFICKLSSTGTLLWKKNLSVTMENQRITAFTCDQQNNFWFCLSDFIDCRIMKLNSFGDINDSIIVLGAKGVTGISFDMFGSLYICGSAAMGTFKIGSFSANVPDSYMMYIARLNSTHGVEWIRFAHDITFQSPQLASDGSGGAYLACDFYDSLSWGNISFQLPQWNSDFFLVRVDSTGNFMWGRSFPVSTSITGRFSLNAPGNYIDTDPAGNVLLVGILYGSVDWGNNVQYQGVLGNNKIQVVSFDGNNHPIWQKTGGGQSNYPTTISVSSQNEVYFTSAVTDTCAFDTIVVNTGHNLATVVVKIIPLQLGTEEPVSRSLLVYPNPAISEIRVPAEWNGKSVAIYGMDGRMIKSFNVSGGLISINGITSGNYLLRCENSYSRLSVISH